MVQGISRLLCTLVRPHMQVYYLPCPSELGHHPVMSKLPSLPLNEHFRFTAPQQLRLAVVFTNQKPIASQLLSGNKTLQGFTVLLQVHSLWQKFIPRPNTSLFFPWISSFLCCVCSFPTNSLNLVHSVQLVLKFHDNYARILTKARNQTECKLFLEAKDVTSNSTN